MLQRDPKEHNLENRKDKGNEPDSQLGFRRAPTDCSQTLEINYGRLHQVARIFGALDEPASIKTC